MFVLFTPEENDFLVLLRSGNSIKSYSWAGLVSQAEKFDDEIVAMFIAKDIQQARIKNEITSLSIQILKLNPDFTADFENPVFEIKAKHQYSTN